MIELLIITNLIFIGLWLLTLRNTRRKSLLLETDYQWKKWGDNFFGSNYYFVNEKRNSYTLGDAAKKQNLTDECLRLNVPQPENKYLAEGWKDENDE